MLIVIAGRTPTFSTVANAKFLLETVLALESMEATPSINVSKTRWCPIVIPVGYTLLLVFIFLQMGIQSCIVMLLLTLSGAIYNVHIMIDKLLCSKYSEVTMQGLLYRQDFTNVNAGTEYNLLVISPLKILRIIGEKPVLIVCRIEWLCIIIIKSIPSHRGIASLGRWI